MYGYKYINRWKNNIYIFHGETDIFERYIAEYWSVTITIFLKYANSLIMKQECSELVHYCVHISFLFGIYYK